MEVNPYIYNLPSTVRIELSAYLDKLNLWENLANHMQLKQGDKDLVNRKQARHESPSNACLEIWGSKYNHTANEVMILLYNMRLPEAMLLLEDYVDARHKGLIRKIQKSTIVGNPQQQQFNIDQYISNSNNNNGNDRPKLTIDSANLSTDLSESKVLQDVKPIPEIDYNELTAGTNNWSDKNILGSGGFGKVYSGTWSYVNVAIKVMDYKQKGDANIKVEYQQSLNELKHLMGRLHPNIVLLYGYCIKGDKPCLVYQLMKGGSLEDRLKAEKYEVLTWEQRYKICRDTAAGINFLHTDRYGKVIIHCDIKPGNILLDEILNAKLGDFGLAREIPRDNAIKVTHVFGTKPYLPSEYLKNKLLSEKIDIFSFGIVLLETFTNKRTSSKTHLPTEIWKLLQNYSSTSGATLTSDQQWQLLQNANNLFDQRIAQPEPGNELNMCCDIVREAFKCTTQKSADRPEKMDLIIEVFDKYKKKL